MFIILSILLIQTCVYKIIVSNTILSIVCLISEKKILYINIIKYYLILFSLEKHSNNTSIKYIKYNTNRKSNYFLIIKI